MNTRYTTVNLDVSQQGSIPSITLSQYDLGVGLSFYIMDGGMPYSEFAETDTVVLSGTKPSGVGFTIPAYYKSENLCSFRTTQAMTTEAGTVTCEITITKVNNISVSTANFFVEVEASAHAHEVVDEDIEDFGLIADQVGEYKVAAVRAAQQAAQSATNAAASASSAEESMEAAQSAASSAIAAKDDIQEYIDDSEAWAKGTRGGEAVPSTDETYENNAKYYAEQSSQASMDAGVSATEAAASAQAAAASVVGAVKYTAQSLTTEQKAQARTNIGAASPSDIPSGTVRYDTAQSLTDAQKTQAKNNIGVPAVDATLAVTGAAADAKKVGDELTDIRGDLSELDGAVFGDEPELTWESGTYINTTGEPSATDWAIRSSVIPYAKAGTTISAQAISGAMLRVLEMSSPTIADADHIIALHEISGGSIETSNDAYLRIAVVKQGITVNEGQLVEYTSSQYLLKTVQQNLTNTQKEQVKENLGLVISNGDGLTHEIKTALLRCIRNVGWSITNGRNLYNLLEGALNKSYPLLTAEYNQMSTVYSNDSLDKLKEDLTITFYENALSPGAIITNYSLSGSLSEEYSLITVSYNSITTFFEAHVEVPLFDYRASDGKVLSEIDGVVSSNVGTGWSESIVDGHLRYYIPASTTTIYARREFPIGNLSHGKIRIKFKGISIPRALGINTISVRLTNGSSGINFGLTSEDNWVTKIVYAQGNSTLTDDSTFTRGDWHTFEATFDENGQKILVDGTVVVESSALSDYYTTFNGIMAINNTNQRSAEFYIDEIQVYGSIKNV